MIGTFCSECGQRAPGSYAPPELREKLRQLAEDALLCSTCVERRHGDGHLVHFGTMGKALDRAAALGKGWALERAVKAIESNCSVPGVCQAHRNSIRYVREAFGEEETDDQYCGRHSGGSPDGICGRRHPCPIHDAPDPGADPRIP